METVARHGFGPDPEHPSLWCGDVLEPQIPEGECECGLKYSTSGISVDSEEVTLYLNMLHYARRMLCKLLYCPLRNHACTLHLQPEIMFVQILVFPGIVRCFQQDITSSFHIFVGQFSLFIFNSHLIRDRTILLII